MKSRAFEIKETATINGREMEFEGYLQELNGDDLGRKIMAVAHEKGVWNVHQDTNNDLSESDEGELQQELIESIKLGIKESDGAEIDLEEVGGKIFFAITQYV